MADGVTASIYQFIDPVAAVLHTSPSAFEVVSDNARGGHALLYCCSRDFYKQHASRGLKTAIALSPLFSSVVAYFCCAASHSDWRLNSSFNINNVNTRSYSYSHSHTYSITPIYLDDDHSYD